MTAGELKEQLDEYDDDTLVVIERYNAYLGRKVFEDYDGLPDSGGHETVAINAGGDGVHKDAHECGDHDFDEEEVVVLYYRGS